MCRLLCVRAHEPFQIRDHLAEFALTAKNSSEDQSHGWGCAWLSNSRWVTYRNINPVWEDKLAFDAQTTCLIAHARSAYRNEGIVLYNNMPFANRNRLFIFNGELNGVRIRIDGRIGAEKIFNFINRYDQGDLQQAAKFAVATLSAKTRYIRAMNFMIAEPQRTLLYTEFNENPDYFQMHEKVSERTTMVSSASYENDTGWKPIENRSLKMFE